MKCYARILVPAQLLLVLLGVVLFAAAWRALVRIGILLIKRLRFKWRVARLRKLLSSVTSPNQAKMFVTRAHLPWPWSTVWLDGHFPGVRLPDHKRSSWMSLQFGEGMPTPIRGLTCDEAGIGGTLSFDAEPFRTWVPWEAVYAITSKIRGLHWSWTDDLDSATRMRVSSALYGKAWRCPACERAPLGDDRWICDGCGNSTNPFSTGNRCLTCGHADETGIRCPQCATCSRIDNWEVVETRAH
jgi:hypothetical protein